MPTLRAASLAWWQAVTAPTAPAACPPLPRWWQRGGGWVLLGLALVAIGLLRAHSFSEPLEADEGMYLLTAQAWATGHGLPYVDLWDNKPVGTYWVYRLGIAAFGYGEQAPRLLALVATWLSTVLLAALTRGWRWPARVVAVALWVPCTCHIASFANSANMEVFLVTFILAALWCLRQSQERGQAGYWYAALALIALSLVIKAQTLPFVVLPWCLLSPAAWRSVRVLALRALTTVALVVGVPVLAFRASGFGPALVWSQWHDSQAYVNQTHVWLPWRVFRQWCAIGVDPALNGLHALFWLALLALLVAALWRRTPAAWQLGLALGAATVAVALPGSNHPHYYILLLPLLALGVGVGVDALLAWAAARPVDAPAPRLPLGVAALVVLLLAGGLGWTTWQHYLRLSPEGISNEKYSRDGQLGDWFIRDRAVGLRLRAMGMTDQRMFVDGSHPTVFVYAGTWPATRYVVDFMVIMGVTTLDDTLRALAANPPPTIVILNERLPSRALRDWAAARYDVAAAWPEPGIEATVLRLK